MRPQECIPLTEENIHSWLVSCRTIRDVLPGMKESLEPQINQALTLHPGDLVLLGRRARRTQACALRKKNFLV
jgi:hypothetical protein